MVKNLFAISFLMCFVFSSPVSVFPAEILNPEVMIQDNSIIVNTGLTDTKEIEPTIKSGIEKEIIFTIELFKVWKFWPDEFVVSKKILRTIKYDNLRERYFAMSYDGTAELEKDFKNFNSMKTWVFKVNNINLVNIKELEPGAYYVRVIAESRSREISPVMGFLMLFIPEIEMSLARESQVMFEFGGSR